MSGDFFDTITHLTVFGVLSGVLSTLAFIPYVVDTSRRRTTPQRQTWLIWSALGTIAFFSQVHEGAGDSLWFAGARVSGAIIVLGLSIRLGTGRRLTTSDYLMLAGAAVGLVLWYNTDSAAYALAITISISLLGGSVTVLEAYQHPGSETMATWVVSFMASVCAILSIGRFDVLLLAYPLYLFTLHGAIVAAMVLGRMRRRSLVCAHRDNLHVADLAQTPRQPGRPAAHIR
ncbi:hypothetical protein [Hoeflea sp.]|uniref:hypothetical protein n=1 Tax=Hoeflea sp. TaxID=1940281 RepID=UPI003B02330F